jgi:hypothetical protein
MDEQARHAAIHVGAGHRALRHAIRCEHHSQRSRVPGLAPRLLPVQLADRDGVHRPDRRLPTFVAALLPALFVLGWLTVVRLVDRSVASYRVQEAAPGERTARDRTSPVELRGQALADTAIDVVASDRRRFIAMVGSTVPGRGQDASVRS